MEKFAKLKSLIARAQDMQPQFSDTNPIVCKAYEKLLREIELTAQLLRMEVLARKKKICQLRDEF